VIVPLLTGSSLKNFDSSVLFYIFYNLPHDRLQIEAFNELVSRGWLYHRKSNRWYIISTAEEPPYGGSSSRRKKSQQQLKPKTVVHYFDTSEWSKV